MSEPSGALLSLGLAGIAAMVMSSTCRGVRGLVAGSLASIALIGSNVFTDTIPLAIFLNMVCMAILSYGIMRNYGSNRAGLILGIGGPLILLPTIAYCFWSTEFFWTDARVWSVMFGLAIMATGLRSY